MHQDFYDKDGQLFFVHIEMMLSQTDSTIGVGREQHLLWHIECVVP